MNRAIALFIYVGNFNLAKFMHREYHSLSNGCNWRKSERTFTQSLRDDERVTFQDEIMNTHVFSNWKSASKAFASVSSAPSELPSDKPRLKMLTTMHSFSLTSYKLLFSIFTSTSFAFISRRIPFVQFDVLNNNTLWVHKAAVNLTCVTRGEPHWSIWRAQEYIMALRAQRHSEGHP